LQDLIAITTILTCFGGATGLKTNPSKTEIFLIRCDEEQIVAALKIFPARRGSFPCMYLDLPVRGPLHASARPWGSNARYPCSPPSDNEEDRCDNMLSKASHARGQHNITNLVNICKMIARFIAKNPCHCRDGELPPVQKNRRWEFLHAATYPPQQRKGGDFFCLNG
jgi:hypothetical protein